jgi:hypothetical protein
VVNARIRARVGQKDESFVHAHCHTVSHSEYPEAQPTPLL